MRSQIKESFISMIVNSHMKINLMQCVFFSWFIPSVVQLSVVYSDKMMLLIWFREKNTENI